MSKHKVGDKFIINIKEVLESEKGTLYRADYNTLTFDDYGPDGLQKHDALQERLELIDELKQAEYNKGLNDAWELARKIADIVLPSERAEIFGYVVNGITVVDILRDFTPQEALAKLKAYEDSKIEVGDVVKDEEGWEYVVTNIYKDRDSCRYNGVTSCGKWTGCYEPTKTGKHIDIKSILKQIGEQYG